MGDDAVRMPVKHSIYTRGASHKAGQVVTAHMGYEDDVVSPFVKNLVNTALQQRVKCCGIESVEPTAKAALEKGRRGQGGDIRSGYPNKGHFTVAIAAYVIAGIDRADLADTGEIAAQNLCIQLADTLLHRLHTEVELMIAQRDIVVAHSIHQPHRVTT